MSIVAGWATPRACLATAVFLVFGVLVRVGHTETALRSLLVAAVAAKEHAIDSGQPVDWERAFDLFRQAHAIAATPSTAYEIGVAAAQLQRVDIAFEAYAAAIDLGLEGPPRAKAGWFVTTNRNGLSRLQPSCPDGSRVLVRGIDRGATPLERPIFVIPGTAIVECVTITNERLHQTVLLLAGEQHAIVLGKDDAPAPKDSPRIVDVSAKSQQAVSAPTGVSPKAPRPPSLAASHDTRQQATPLIPRRTTLAIIAAGASMALIGGIFGAFSSSQIEEGSQALARTCSVLSGPDSCSHAKPGLRSEAQSHSNSIATWQNVRVVSWTSLGLGVAATLGGSAWLVIGERERSRGMIPLVAVSAEHFSVHCQYSF